MVNKQTNKQTTKTKQNQKHTKNRKHVIVVIEKSSISLMLIEFWYDIYFGDAKFILIWYEHDKYGFAYRVEKRKKKMLIPYMFFVVLFIHKLNPGCFSEKESGKTIFKTLQSIIPIHTLSRKYILYQNKLCIVKFWAIVF